LSNVLNQKDVNTKIYLTIKIDRNQRKMETFEDLDSYNGDTEHDMWVDFDYHKNTGELPEIFDDADVKAYVNSLNDWD